MNQKGQILRLYSGQREDTPKAAAHRKDGFPTTALGNDKCAAGMTK